MTSYLIFQGIAPSIWGPLSDVKGRRVAYVCTFVVFLGACIGLALTKNYAMLIVLRCLQSAGSASTIAIGAGVIGDITTRAERGGFMGMFQAGSLVPVSVGPIIGGALAGSLGWRSIFWFLTIFSGTFLVFLVLLLPETLRSVVGNGSRTPSNPISRFPLVVYQKTTRVKWDQTTSPTQAGAKKRVDLTGPLRILITKYAAPLIIFLALYYAVWQMSITALSTLFEKYYGLGETQIGLTFIANGVGSLLGTLATGKLLDMEYHRFKTRHEARLSEAGVDLGQPPSNSGDSFPLERARLRFIPVLSLLQCLAILLFGWSIQYADHVHIAVPIISTFVTGWTVSSSYSIIGTYLVDIFPDHSAAAIASMNLARCLIAAGGTSLIMPMINKMGVGLALTVCVIVQVVAFSGVIVQWKFGAAWREEKRKRTASQGTSGDIGN